MNPDPHHYYLLAAYLLTWAIHGTYLVILARKHKKIRQEIDTLRRKTS
jgi:CcmD family protein